VEEVDTGKRVKFRSTEEMLRFLGQTFEEALRRERELNQRKEQEDDGWNGDPRAHNRTESFGQLCAHNSNRWQIKQ
jgi:hypothetical protein